MKRTALAQLVELYAECRGVTTTAELAKLTGYSERAIWKAKAELRCTETEFTMNHSSVNQSAETCTRVQVSSRAHKLPEEIKKTPLPPKGDQQGDLLEDEKPSKAQQAFDMFNALAREKNLPVARKLTPALKTKIEARLKEGGGLDEWKELLEIVTRSPLLLGKVPGKNGGAPFKATLDWIAGPQNYSKIINGAYEKINGASIHSRMNGLSEEEQYRLVRQMRAN